MSDNAATTYNHHGQDRRREKRHRVRPDTFIVNTPNLGQLIDISMSGLAFAYFDWEDWPENFQEINIFHPDEGYCLHNLPSDTISDCVLTTFMQDLTSSGQRRRGVHFRELSPAQVEDLLLFIETNATGCE